MVAGGGIVGTWHAFELVQAGFSVDHLEADAGPTGASVRNFGLVWVSGRRSGEELDVAQRARRRWEEVGTDVPGLGFRATGSLTVAANATERDVMEAFARHPDAAPRAVTFLEPEDVRRCNPAVRGDVAGALHCAADAVVEPRHALGALRQHLTTSAPDRYRFHPGRRVVAVGPRTLVDTAGTRWAGDLAVVATGAAYDHLPGARAADRPVAPRAAADARDGAVRRRTHHVAGRRRQPALLPGLRGGAPRRVGNRRAPWPREHHLQLLLVQRPDGGLTIGDTHAYGEPFDFALAEEPTEELLARAARILGADLPPVRRRWEGVYSQCTDGRVCLREQIDEACGG